jgi:hypothetical protein
MRQRRATAAVGLLLTAALLPLHLVFLRHAGALWRDEVNGLNLVTLPSFAEVFAQRHLDSFPMVWVSVLYSWAAVAGDADAALRRLGLVIGLATIATLWWTARRLALAAPLVTLLLFAMSPSAIIYGDSLRGYGLGALAVAFCLGAVWWFVDRPSRRSALLALAAALLAVHTYFPNGILLAAIIAGAAAVCLCRRAWPRLAAVLAIGALASATMVFNLAWIRYALEVGAVEQGSWSIGWLLSVFRQALAPGAPLLALAWAAAALLAATGAALTWWSPRGAGADRERALFVAVAAVVGLVGYFVYLRFIARLPTLLWYYLSPMVLVALACDVAIALLAARFRYGVAAQALAVAALAALGAADVLATVRVRMTNLDVVAAKLEELAAPADLVVVFPWVCGITFERYYRGAAAWITLPDFEEHEFHRHLWVAEKMKLGEKAVAPELDRVERTLREGQRVWVVGALVAPPPGQPLPPLPPAPSGPQGWRAAPYLDHWERQLGALLQEHGRDLWRIALPDLGAVNAWENLPLIQVEGWR